MSTIGRTAVPSHMGAHRRWHFLRRPWRRVRNLTLRIWAHPANSGHRVRAFLRVLHFYFSALVLHSPIQVPLGEHSRIWADRRQACSFEVVVGNPPDWNEMQAWRRILGASSLFVDVGANVGTYSLWAADLGSRVIAVEPAKDAQKALRMNADLNGIDLALVPAALGAEPGIMRFTESLGTRNHLIPEAGGDGVEVEVRTLDAVLGNRTADGVKIDVEGAEHMVLDGARTALVEGRLPIIQLEWNVMADRVYGDSRERLAETLSGYGYKFYRPDQHGNLQPAGIETSRTDLFAVLERPD